MTESSSTSHISNCLRRSCLCQPTLILSLFSVVRVPVCRSPCPSPKLRNIRCHSKQMCSAFAVLRLSMAYRVADLSVLNRAGYVVLRNGETDVQLDSRSTAFCGTLPCISVGYKRHSGEDRSLFYAANWKFSRNWITSTACVNTTGSADKNISGVAAATLINAYLCIR